ncbi:unnamed protein product [Calypogeia fissa]
MSSIGGLLFCTSSHHLFPQLLPQQHCQSNTSTSWSFSAIQKESGHSFVPSYGPRQCEAIGNSRPYSGVSCRQTTMFAASGSGGADYKLEVRELSRKAANNDVILDRVSFEVKAGAVHGLVGPSGCGKTTVLRALNRLWEPPAGTVFYEGVDVTTMEVISLRLRVGMVFQAAAMFGGKVADNVNYGPKLRGINLSTERVEELLLQAGISEPSVNFLAKSTRELSGGEAQRVSLARALANDPSVLLMDEPTSSLDPSCTRIVENTIQSLVNDLGLTVVLVSHDMDQIARVADLATILGKGGVVLETATPAQLRKSENEVLTEFFTAYQN